MVKQISLDKHKVASIAYGDVDGLNALLSFVHQMVHYESKKKGLSLVDSEDVTATALLDILMALPKSKSPADLERIVKHVVRQVTQRYRRDVDRQFARDISIDGSFDFVDDSPGIDDQLIAEELVAERLKLKSEKARILYKGEKTPEAELLSRADLLIVDDELIRYFKNHPEEMYKLNPRRFEELIAEILKDLGYSVELTAQSADGGVDIFATQKSGIGEVLLIVDCKRYAPTNHVGVEMVRALYGISEQLRATMAMIATTSFFTKPAQAFQRTLCHRLSLKDYNDLNLWLANYSDGRLK